MQINEKIIYHDLIILFNFITFQTCSDSYNIQLWYLFVSHLSIEYKIL